jgi:hypothetical protein
MTRFYDCPDAKSLALFGLDITVGFTNNPVTVKPRTVEPKDQIAERTGGRGEKHVVPDLKFSRVRRGIGGAKKDEVL